MIEFHCGDALTILRRLPAESVQAIVTSPPYFGLRNYGHSGQIGLEETINIYVNRLVQVFGEARRVLRRNGTCWLNLGDSYAGDWARRSGLKRKDLAGIPWRVALALQADEWFLRADVIWAKPNAQPESVKDRPTNAHEYLFLLSRSARYYYDRDAIREPLAEATLRDKRSHMGNRRISNRGAFSETEQHLGGKRLVDRRGRNKRSVWNVSLRPYQGAHFAAYPPDLIRPCIRASTQPGDVVLDPFLGSGTTAQVCMEEGRGCLGIELNPAYIELARERLKQSEVVTSTIRP